MQTVPIVLDDELLRAANRAATRSRMNRSALVREALRQHLRRLEIRKLEIRDRRGYRKRPDTGSAASDWERVAGWPKD